MAGAIATAIRTHDAAGNLTYDGNFAYTYDAWGRLVQVRRAYRDSGGALAEGSVVATIRYDGLNRRISKAVTNCGDMDCTYHYYYDGWRLLEERNGSGQVLRQYVWGLGYVDELVRIAVNDDPADGDECETLYYPLHDANFNVLGLADAGGDLVERYEYTPYGQRTVYKSSGSDDPLCLSPIMESRRVKVSGVDQPYGICDVGFQGLTHDKESGLLNIRNRYGNPILARLMTWDPLDYPDGMNGYEWLRSNPIIWCDPMGEQGLPSFAVHMEPGVNVSVSYEFVRRVIERNILPSAALDAARNPLSITKIVYDAKGRPSQQLIGKYATVVINPRDGRLVTTWRTKRKLAEKLGAKLINSKPQLRPTRPDGLSKGFGTALLMLSILDMTAGDANAAEIDWWNIDGDADGIPASVDPDDHVVSCCTEKDKIACWDDYAERLQYVWKEEIRFTWFGLSTTREWVYNFSWKRESDRKLEQCFKDCDLGDKENGHAVDSNKR